MKIKGLIQETGENISGGNTSLPLGSVIDWWRPDPSFSVPNQFLAADGSQINDANSPFNGYNLPDLVDRFIISTTSEASIGQTGGADSVSLNHTHNSTSHNHTGSHVHGVLTGAALQSSPEGFNAASDNTVVTEGHSHGQVNSSSQSNSTLSTSSTSYTANNNTVSKLPIYLGVLKLVKINYGLKIKHNGNVLNGNIIDSNSGVPLGGIIPWWTNSASPAAVPNNYQLCDGSVINNSNSSFNGYNTPNLIDRFLRGVAEGNINSTGGANSQSWNHTHPFNCPGHSMNHNHSGSVGGSLSFVTVDGGGGATAFLDHTHPYTTDNTNLSFPAVNSTTSSSNPSISTIPSYLTLVYLVRII